MSTHISSNIADLQQDIDELASFIHAVKSPRLRVWMESYQRQLLDARSNVSDSNSNPALNDETTTNTDSVEAESAPAPLKEQTPPPAHTKTQSPDAVTNTFNVFPSFYWDQDQDNIYVYVTLDQIGQSKESVNCSFNKDSFDLQVLNFQGKSYRLVKKPFPHDIVPEQSCVKIFKKRIKLIMRKTPGKYGADHWTCLEGRKQRASNSSDPTAGLMDMMKQLYDDGDDQMRKTIGEAMMKSREGKNSTDFDMPEMPS